MKVKALSLLETATKLLKGKTPTPRLDAEVLLSHMLKVDRVELYQLDEISWSKTQQTKWDRMIQDRMTGQPVAQLTGVREFMDTTFHVNKYVLIPRPETEQIVLKACEIVRQHPELPVYDIGTGSGAIAVMVSKLTNRLVTASDISLSALRLATRNVRGTKVKLLKSNLGTHIKKPGIVVANLPYLPEVLKKDKTLAFEPPLALFAGKDGLDLYRKLFKQVVFKIAIIELGSKQFKPMESYLKELYPESLITPIHDLGGTICGLTLSRTE